MLAVVADRRIQMPLALAVLGVGVMALDTVILPHRPQVQQTLEEVAAGVLLIWLHQQAALASSY
jgi:hypothetical protein